MDIDIIKWLFYVGAENLHRQNGVSFPKLKPTRGNHPCLPASYAHEHHLFFPHVQTISIYPAYVVVTCKIRLFQKYFSLHRCPPEIVLPEIISTLFQRLIVAHEYFPTRSMSLI